MRTEIKRDVDHNYLILQENVSVDTSAYQVRMLTGNVVPSILKCHIQCIDGVPFFYYDITSKQSISVLYEEKKFKRKDLQMIFGGFVQAIEELTEFLMNVEQLLLDPEYIYIDLEAQKVYFCCLPGFNKELQEQFRELTEYILPKLDHEDEYAVVMGYGIYRRALEQGFQLETVKEAVYHRETSETSKKEKRAADDRNKEYESNITDLEMMEQISDRLENENKEDKKKLSVKMVLIWSIGIFALLSLPVASAVGFIPWLPVEIAVGTGIFILGAGTLSVWFMEKVKGKQEEESLWRKKPVHSMEERNEPVQVQEKEEVEPIVEQENVDITGETGPLFDSVLKEQGLYGETTVLSTGQRSGPSSLVSREPGELATIYLDKELMVIGKLNNAADAVIPVQTVSRVHARIRKKESGYFLTDLNSRNGTAVNGRMLKGNEEYLLQDEDEIDFAQARYIFLQ